MPQLKMIFNSNTAPMPELIIPEGFTLRALRDGDLAAYNRLRASVEFNTWTAEELAAYRKKALPEGSLVIVSDQTGEFAASAGAETTDMPEYPRFGVLGWVMTDPKFNGHHLGRVVSVAAMHRLHQAGYRIFTLLTDDFRTPALATYLKLGWRPWLFEGDMEARWRAIAARLGRSFESLHAVTDPEGE